MTLRRGFSLVELLVVIAIIGILLAVAIPSIERNHMNSVEIVVIKEVQTIGVAQTQYLSQFGRYASTLAQLGPPSGEKDGYIFTMTGTGGGYIVNAVPKEFGSTGRRTFFMDQDGIVHQNWGREMATAGSPEI